MAMIIEQAGGVASTGMFNGKIQRVLDLVPTEIHDKCPIIMGGKRDVQRVYDEYVKAGVDVPSSKALIV
jgi:fructose-1,6-bisphosphatase I